MLSRSIHDVTGEQDLLARVYSLSPDAEGQYESVGDELMVTAQFGEVTTGAKHDLGPFHAEWRYGTVYGRNAFATREQVRDHVISLRHVLSGADTGPSPWTVAHEVAHSSLWKRFLNWLSPAQRARTEPPGLVLDQDIFLLTDPAQIDLTSGSFGTLVLDIDPYDVTVGFVCEPFVYWAIPYSPGLPQRQVIELALQVFRTLLRHVSESIGRLLRALGRPNRLHEFIIKQRSWLLLHSARPPRSSSYWNSIQLPGAIG